MPSNEKVSVCSLLKKGGELTRNNADLCRSWFLPLLRLHPAMTKSAVGYGTDALVDEISPFHIPPPVVDFLLDTSWGDDTSFIADKKRRYN